MTLETEQWRLNGDCNKCRRENYCNKPCTAKKKRSARELQNIAHTIIDMAAPTSTIAEETKKWL